MTKIDRSSDQIRVSLTEKVEVVENNTAEIRPSPRDLFKYQDAEQDHIKYKSEFKHQDHTEAAVTLMNDAIQVTFDNKTKATVHAREQLRDDVLEEAKFEI